MANIEFDTTKTKRYKTIQDVESGATIWYDFGLCLVTSVFKNCARERMIVGLKHGNVFNVSSADTNFHVVDVTIVADDDPNNYDS